MEILLQGMVDYQKEKSGILLSDYLMGHHGALVTKYLSTDVQTISDIEMVAIVVRFIPELAGQHESIRDILLHSEDKYDSVLES